MAASAWAFVCSLQAAAAPEPQARGGYGPEQFPLGLDGAMSQSCDDAHGGNTSKELTRPCFELAS